VTTNGDVIRAAADENREIFTAGRVGLGLFGVMTEIGMKVRPRYKLQKNYFVHSIEETFRQLDGMAKANRHFEFFWFTCNDFIVCKSLNETNARAPEPRSSAAMRARGERPSLKSFATVAINELLPVAPFLCHPSHRILSILRKSFGRVRWSNETFPTPRVIRFQEMEYALPYENGVDAVREIVEAIRKKRIVTGYPIVFRIVEGDDIWLSPFYGRRSAVISVPVYAKHDGTPLFEICEAIFRRYDGRPHWGKYHTMTAEEAARLYPKYDDFRALRKRLDPTGKLLNAYLRNLLPQ
jgi:FAD/FMN-containing dehydrogenase